MLRQQLCRLDDGPLLHTSNRSYLVQVQAGKLGLVGDLTGVDQGLAHTCQQHVIGGYPGLQPDVRLIGQAGLASIDRDQGCAFA